MKTHSEVIFILYVSDQEKSKIFYRETFGEEPVLDVPGMTDFQITSNARIGLMPAQNIARIISPPLPHPETAQGIPRCEAYIYVETPEEFMERAIKAGAKLISTYQQRNWGDAAGYVADPDGHILVFAKKN